MKNFTGYLKLKLGDSYVLLAGGSHKSLSDFKIGDYLPLSGGALNNGAYISWKDSAVSSLITDSTYMGICMGILLSCGPLRISADTDASTSTENVIITAGYTMANATAANGLAIGKTTLKWKGTNISLEGHTHEYIPKGGFTTTNTTPGGWGTITTSNGYTGVLNLVTSDSAALVIGKKAENADNSISIQVDGFFYQNEGRYKVLDTNNWSSYITYSTMGLDNRYVLKGGDTMTGLLIMSNTSIWVQSNNQYGGTGNRFTLTSGLPTLLPYTGSTTGKVGAIICANGIAFRDTLNYTTGSYTYGNDAGWMRIMEEESNTGILEIATGDDGTEEIRFRRYNTSNAIVSDVLVPNYTGTLALTSDIKNATLTLLMAGTTSTTFYANDSTNRTFNVTCAGIGTYTKNEVDNTFVNVNGDVMTGALTIKGVADTGLYSLGGFNKAYANIILQGDNTYGVSGIVFKSMKGNDTDINTPSDVAFIQYHPYGVTAAAYNTTPTEASSGELGRLVIGIGNDTGSSVGEELWLQTAGANDLKHYVVNTAYTILDSGNFNTWAAALSHTHAWSDITSGKPFEHHIYSNGSYNWGWNPLGLTNISHIYGWSFVNSSFSSDIGVFLWFTSAGPESSSYNCVNLSMDGNMQCLGSMYAGKNLFAAERIGIGTISPTAALDIRGDVVVKNNTLWILSSNSYQGSSNRMSLTAGHPTGLAYSGSTANKVGLMLCSNAIMIRDPYSTYSNDGCWIRHIEETNNEGIMEIAVGDDGVSQPIYFRGYDTSSVVAWLIYMSNGNLYASNYYTTSDRTKKKNINQFSKHISKFTLKETNKDAYGVIAQEVPEMFRDGEEGNMTVNYSSVLSYYIGLLENKVSELSETVKELAKEISKLKDLIK